MRTISIGKQNFASLRENDFFYVDKTDFIREWWENGDDVTLIARPRRFGKTLNMSMLECFFSNRYENRKDLFKGLSIWREKKYRLLQGAYPVLSITFSSAKGNTYETLRKQICALLAEQYRNHRYLSEGDCLSAVEKKEFDNVNADMDDTAASLALQRLCGYLGRYYGKNVIVLLDEYDSPLQEAYVGGYWEELVNFTRSIFNATFKSNPYLERAVMTGVTRMSKEFIFSDLNNLRVVTTTSQAYAAAFGFTEGEVYAALEEAGMSGEKERVKEWYDGFTFGRVSNIYNPWSITNFLKEKTYQTFWASTSSNALVSSLIRTGTRDIKQHMEDLLEGKSIYTEIDEQIVFDQLGGNEGAVWSLLLAGGYLKVKSYAVHPRTLQKQFELSLTNFEVELMFERLIREWFGRSEGDYQNFAKSLLQGDLKAMNHYMNKVALDTFGFFDTVNHPSERTEPERFYHGFVLGLLVDQREHYQIKSNRESDFGRYDVLMQPRSAEGDGLPALVLEFKVHDAGEEDSLKETVAAALRQIREKEYDAELISAGIPRARIRHYGFAFEGKHVLIGTDQEIFETGSH